MKYVLCRNPGCGVTISRERGERRVYCSNACRQMAYRKRTHRPLPTPVRKWERYCVNCGQKFTTSKPTQQFCRSSCRSSFWQQMRRLALKGQ